MLAAIIAARTAKHTCLVYMLTRKNPHLASRPNEGGFMSLGTSDGNLCIFIPLSGKTHELKSSCCSLQAGAVC